MTDPIDATATLDPTTAAAAEPIVDPSPFAPPPRPEPVALTWAEAVALGEPAGGVFLGTVQPDGRPHVAWVMPGWADERLWIATFRSSQKGVNLRHAQEVALHWPAAEGAALFGRAAARLVDDPAESADLWDAGVIPYDLAMFFGAKENPDLLFVELVAERLSWSSVDPTAPFRIWTAGH